MKDGEKIRLSTLGVKPLTPVIFWDFDRTPIEDITKFARKNFIEYDIYLSSKGKYHLVAPADTYDTVQDSLEKIKQQFPSEVYIMNCRRLRLRITAKVDDKGREIVPAPVLIECFCNGAHVDKRTGILEVYYTKW